jgi:PhoH-like ATPase
MLHSEVSIDGLLHNQCCYFTVSGKTLHTIYEKDAGIFKIVKTPTPIKGKVLPINIEQALLYNIAMDPEIFLVTSGGYAGTGKTLMALAAGYEQLGKLYEQIIVYRPNCPLGQDLGFLPGDIGEKFAPWMLPILDNMHLILGKNETYNQKDGDNFGGKNCNPIIELMREKLLEISPINFLRGRSINNCYIIIDEAQNLTPHEARTIVSRAGGGTKIILTGDIMQIDNPHVDSVSNGLTHTIECMKGLRRFGHVKLSKSERSELAELAATRM